MVLYVCNKEWLIRLGYEAHGINSMEIMITKNDIPSYLESFTFHLDDSLSIFCFQIKKFFWVTSSN